MQKSQINQRYTFFKAYNNYIGKTFVSGKNIPLTQVQSFNFMHVLPKSTYPMFKYYERNIVLGTLEEHQIWDSQHLNKRCRLREIVNHYQRGCGDKKRWMLLLELEQQLKEEYVQWRIRNYKTYKL